MANPNVHDMARNLTEKAASEDAGRASHTLYGGHDKALRQTLIVLQEGQELAAHESPGEATLLVLEGRVRVSAGDGEWEGADGDLVPMPPSRHSVAALSDVVMLLTVVK
ncbi:cupin domain-containing protein [Raineyella fluvialis]|uniref:LuxR family transcriptional regulator n=1 Tax=Raineyella fluvialis TaxID=2662261 RepID=A0A5Q2FD68_9ACTN|nr:cupin domain-containing protein [Raineyella fluvialis]QGF22655.1 LuxR family transcriptional regulator [Raineyella fluvialis]